MNVRYLPITMLKITSPMIMEMPRRFPTPFSRPLTVMTTLSPVPPTVMTTPPKPRMLMFARTFTPVPPNVKTTDTHQFKTNTPVEDPQQPEDRNSLLPSSSSELLDVLYTLPCSILNSPRAERPTSPPKEEPWLKDTTSFSSGDVYVPW